MKKIVSRQEMMREVMKSAHLHYRMGQRYSWAKEQTWSECLRAAWECVKARCEVRKAVKVNTIKVTRCEYSVDLTTQYGTGAYMGD